MSKLHELCAEYGFCTPETRAELQESGFDFSSCKFGIATKFVPFYASRMNVHETAVKNFGIIAYPQAEDLLKLLPSVLQYHYTIITTTHNVGYYSFMNYNYNDFRISKLGSENKAELLAKLWLQLKKGGVVNG